MEMNQGVKRSAEDGGQGSTKQMSKVIADHYNKLPDKGLEERKRSRIFYMRNFNNWVKSMLIGEYIKKIKSDNDRVNVLDLCCGKGGDLLKWKMGNVNHVVCADIAGTSISQCESRYLDLSFRRQRFEKGAKEVYTAEFITADCTKAELREYYKDRDIEFDLVSCQFSFHYCFESLPQVECMMKNISQNLRPGGFFIGTTPDSNQIVHRLKTSGGLSFGNDVYSITFHSNYDSLPLFGAKYDFHLEDVVDCPEFLVYFPLLEKIAEKYGLKLIFNKRFDEYYHWVMETEGHSRHPDSGRQLLGKMQALETYPPFSDDLASSNEADYTYAKEKLESLDKDSGHRPSVGTISQSEWDAISLYLVFAFVKLEK
ncbi:hypothetical protein CHUAL_011457 [Chamberlinius hualienensis]